MEKNTENTNKKRILRLDAKGRIFVTLGAMILLSILINSMISWIRMPEELHVREAHQQNVYDPEAFFLDEKGRLCYEDKNWTSYICVDVSSYQNEVDWRQVAADGVEFAMIRLGYRGYSSGQLNLDPCYEQNIKGARDAGLHTGVYFFSQAVTEEETMDEARFVLRKLRGKNIDGPVAFDMEYIEGAQRINHLTAEEKTAIANAFCQVIEENGYEAIIYGNPTWFTEDVNLEGLTEHGIWLAHYIEMTAWPFDYWMWQYTDQGTVAGIEGGCDLNIWMEPKI